MKCNVAYFDRVLRFIIGVFTVSFAIGGGPTWFYLGMYFIFTAAWGLCPIYLFLRVRTLGEKSSHGTRHFENSKFK